MAASAAARPLDRAVAAGPRALFRLPRPLLRRIAGPERRNDRGDVLDLHMQLLIRLNDMMRFPKAYEQTVADARVSFDRQAFLADVSPPAVAETEELALDGPAGRIPLRVYRPRRTSEQLPVLVYYHGGGYVIGSLEAYDGVCRRLAIGGDCIVVSVDYRMGPDARFPAAIEDGVAAFGWALDNAERIGGDTGRVAVGGDSAGGGVAAVVCHRRRDEGAVPPAFQLLVYPAVDLTREMESHRLFAHGYFLEKPLKDWFVENYLPGPEHTRDPLASPLHAERFDGLPPTVVVSAGFDPLRDEDEAYAERLRQAGAAVEELYEPTLVHGFLNMADVPAAAAARERITRSLRGALSR